MKISVVFSHTLRLCFKDVVFLRDVFSQTWSNNCQPKHLKNARDSKSRPMVSTSVNNDRCRKMVIPVLGAEGREEEERLEHGGKENGGMLIHLAWGYAGLMFEGFHFVMSRQTGAKKNLCPRCPVIVA